MGPMGGTWMVTNLDIAQGDTGGIWEAQKYE